MEKAAKAGKIKIVSINDYTAEEVEIEIKLARGVYAADTIRGPLRLHRLRGADQPQPDRDPRQPARSSSRWTRCCATIPRSSSDDLEQGAARSSSAGSRKSCTPACWSRSSSRSGSTNRSRKCKTYEAVITTVRLHCPAALSGEQLLRDGHHRGHRAAAGDQDQAHLPLRHQQEEKGNQGDPRARSRRSRHSLKDMVGFTISLSGRPAEEIRHIIYPRPHRTDRNLSEVERAQRGALQSDRRL